MAGKGDTPRPVNREKYAENFDRIFPRRPPRTAKQHPGRPVAQAKADRTARRED